MTLHPPAAEPYLHAMVEETDLVNRAKKGDAQAKEDLALRHRRAAYLLALQLTGNPDDALDVAHDALLRFFRTLNRFQADRPVRPWLLTIVRNRVRDIRRRRRARPSQSLEDRPEGMREIIDSAPGPMARAERRELQLRVWRALNELKAPQREILVLRDYQDMSYNEIAGVLEIPRGTVMSRLHRARKTLRSIFDRHGVDGV